MLPEFYRYNFHLINRRGLLSWLPDKRYIVISLKCSNGDSPDYPAMLAKLRSLSINNVGDQCRLVDRAWSTACALPPPPSDSDLTWKCNPCGKVVALLKRCQPLMLESWTSVYTDGDSNCMFRALSQAVFGTPSLHVQLRVLTCLEVGKCRSNIHNPNGISSGSAVFAGLMTVTDRPTDRPRYSVSNNRPHLRTMQPKIWR